MVGLAGALVLLAGVGGVQLSHRNPSASEIEQLPRAVAQTIHDNLASSLVRGVDQQVERELQKSSGADTVHVPGGIDFSAFKFDSPRPTTPSSNFLETSSLSAATQGLSQQIQSMLPVNLDQQATAVQARLQHHLDTTRQTMNSAADLWALCDEQLHALLKKTLNEKEAALLWVNTEKTNAMQALEQESRKITEIASQIKQIQKTNDESQQKRNNYALQQDQLLTKQKLGGQGQGDSKVQDQLVLLDLYEKATENMVSSLSTAVEERQAAVAAGREWYSSSRDALSQWLKEQEMLVRMRLNKRKETSDTLQQQCKQLDQVRMEAGQRGTHYEDAIEREKLQMKTTSLKQEVFGKREKITEAAAEIEKLKREAKVAERALAGSLKKLQIFQVEETQIAPPPQSWLETLSLAASSTSPLLSVSRTQNQDEPAMKSFELPEPPQGLDKHLETGVGDLR